MQTRGQEDLIREKDTILESHLLIMVLSFQSISGRMSSIAKRDQALKKHIMRFQIKKIKGKENLRL